MEEKIEEKKLDYDEFIRRAILTLRKEPYKGIHTVYSGFNEAFKKYYDGQDPVEITNKLAAEGKVIIKPVRGGVMLYLPEDAPQGSKTEDILKKMGL
jgi:hypothetical protein